MCVVKEGPIAEDCTSSRGHCEICRGPHCKIQSTSLKTESLPVTSDYAGRLCKDEKKNGIRCHGVVTHGSLRCARRKEM